MSCEITCVIVAHQNDDLRHFSAPPAPAPLHKAPPPADAWQRSTSGAADRPTGRATPEGGMPRSVRTYGPANGY